MCVRCWPVQTKGRSGLYSNYFNGPDSGSGSTPSATANSVLRELPKETLDGLAMEKSPESLGVMKGNIIERVGEDIYVTPAMRFREKKLSRRKYISQQVRHPLNTSLTLSQSAQAIV